MIDIEQVCLAGLEEQARQGAGRTAGLNGTCSISGGERTLGKWVFSTLFPACMRHSPWLRIQSVTMKGRG